MADVRRYHPDQKRDPNGEWGDGIPGSGLSKIVGRIQSEDGHDLELSSSPTGGAVVRFPIPEDADGQFDALTLPPDAVDQLKAGLDDLDAARKPYMAKVRAAIRRFDAAENGTPEYQAAQDAFFALAGDGQIIGEGSLPGAGGGELHWALAMGDEDPSLWMALKPPDADADWNLHDAAADGGGGFFPASAISRLRKQLDKVGTGVAARNYDPHQLRDPDGEWGDGVPGPGFDLGDLTAVQHIEGTFGELAMGVDPAGDVRLAFHENGEARELDLSPADVGQMGDALDRLAGERENIDSSVAADELVDDEWFGDEQQHRVALYGSGIIQVTFGAEDDDPWTLSLDPPDAEGDDVGTVLQGVDAVLAEPDGRSRRDRTDAGHRALPPPMAGPLPYWLFTTGRRQSAMPELPTWMTGQRSFQPADHPRAPTGTDNGGEFAKAVNSSKKAAATTAKRRPAGKPTGKPAARPRKPDDGTLAYDPQSNQGTGYGNPHGDDRVHALQQALNRLGVTDSTGKPLKDDGKLGPKTTASVKALQTRLGLKADGKVTPALLAQVKSLKSLPAQKRSGVMDFCVRSFGFQFEERSRNTDGRTLEGYAAVFNTPTRIAAVGGDFDEVITPGAFTRSIRSRMPVLQFEHGRDPRVGAVPIGAIQDLSEDSQGLHVRAQLFDNPVVEPVRQAIEGRAIKGMSFRFNVVDGGDQWTRRSGNIDLRAVGDADVHELGPVVFPAYDTTTVSVRSLLAQLGPEEHRTLLRELAHDLRSLENPGVGPSARSSGGTGIDQDASRDEPRLSIRQRLDQGALQARGILQ